MYWLSHVIIVHDVNDEREDESDPVNVLMEIAQPFSSSLTTDNEN